MMAEITDPTLLQQLNTGNIPPSGGEVTDPALLQQLNGPQRPSFLQNFASGFDPAGMTQVATPENIKQDPLGTAANTLGPALSGAGVAGGGTGAVLSALGTGVWGLAKEVGHDAMFAEILKAIEGKDK